MTNQGNVRNSIFNVPAKGVPHVERIKISKALRMKDPQLVNQTFYSYGAKHTNIRDKLNKS